MQHPNPNEHARHDALLIAGHAAGDLSDSDRARADALLASCAECAELRRDLVAIAAATRSTPAPARLLRDLRLTQEQAQRLRRGSWLRGLLRPFASAGSPVRPVASAFTTLGVVGLVVGLTLGSVAAPGGAATTQPEGQRPVMELRASAGAGGAEHQPMATTGLAQVAGAAASPKSEVDVESGSIHLDQASAPAVAVDNGGIDPAPGAPSDGSRTVATPPPSTMLIAGSLGLLCMGLLLFGLRIAGRRLR